MPIEYQAYGSDDFVESKWHYSGMTELNVNVYKRGISTTYVDKDVLDYYRGFVDGGDVRLRLLYARVSGDFQDIGLLAAFRLRYLNIVSGDVPLAEIIAGTDRFTVYYTSGGTIKVVYERDGSVLGEVQYDLLSNWCFIVLVKGKLYILDKDLNVLFSKDIKNMVSHDVDTCTLWIGYIGVDGSEYGAEYDYVYVRLYAEILK